MSIFDTIGRLMKKPAPGLLALEKAEVDAQAALDAAKAKLADLEAGRVEAVLGGDDARTAHRASLQTARDDLEDAQAALLAIQSRLAQEREAAAEAARIAAYDAAIAKRDEVAALIREKYPQLAGGLVDLICASAEADLAIGAANANLPAGAERLEAVELVARARPGTPRKLISEKKVRLWCHRGTKIPCAQSNITDQGNGRGIDKSGGRFDGHTFIERRWERERYVELAEKLSALDLPGLIGGEPNYWTAAPWNTADTILKNIKEHEALRRAYRAAPPEPPEIEVEHELVIEPPAQAAE
ncbi:hypothetical protein K9U40_21705 [Xanthobacter autotrophicus]|uniref:hypothetical protein n=1 Tax=Xanthobacter TaxID=279 RepID=UPI0024AC70D4|nr:hypothetical protein [Xanthobacter autotrophicus]MDI4666916.1 hypothetical protein [Xanthobacter autotrophicus]